MTNEVANTYSTHIISTISSLEDQLKEIHFAQNELLDAVTKLKESSITEAELAEIRTNMDKVSTYNTKLLSLKATMSMLTGRSKQLQERANKLKQMKLKYLSQIDNIRKFEQEKDQIIAAKTSLSSPALMSLSPAISPTSDDNTSIQTISPDISASNSTTDILKIKSLTRKKKKSKAREALIGDDDDSTNGWIPKRSLGQKDLASKKP